MLAQNGVHSKSSALSASQETVIQQHGARLQALVAEMIGGVLQAVQEHQPLHELERQTWARLLSMGHEVLALLFALLGPGDGYLTFRIEQETQRLHPHRAELKEMKWAQAI